MERREGRREYGEGTRASRREMGQKVEYGEGKGGKTGRMERREDKGRTGEKGGQCMR